MPFSRRDYLAAAHIAFAAGFVLAGYSAIRNAANTLFKQSYGAERLPLLMAVMPLGVLAILYVYALLLSRLGPRRTLWVTTLGSAAVIAGCYLLIRAEPAWPAARLARAAVRIFSDAYIALLIEQYWSFLNSTLDTRTAKRLNGPIMGVASLGAIAGAWLVGAIVVRYGTASMLLVAAASLVPAALLSDLAYRRAGEPKPRETEPQRHGGLAWRLFARRPLLTAILAMVVMTQVLAAVLDLNYQTVLQAAIPQPDAQTKWAAQFEGWMNAAAAIMQFVLTPLLLRAVSVPAILLAMPVVQVVAGVASFARPSLASAAGAYLVFKMFDYSLFKAAKETLYIPLTYDERYRAKEVVDVLGYRSAKGAMSAVLAGLTATGVQVARAYGPFAIAAAAAWAVAAAAVGRLSRVEARIEAGADSSPAPSDSPAMLR